jgi:hypothetical protein
MAKCREARLSTGVQNCTPNAIPKCALSKVAQTAFLDRRTIMTIQTTTRPLDKRERDSHRPGFDYDTFAPVLMMSCTGLSISLLIITIAGR